MHAALAAEAGEAEAADGAPAGASSGAGNDGLDVARSKSSSTALLAAIARGVAAGSGVAHGRAGAEKPLGPGIIAPALCDTLPFLTPDTWPELVRLLLCHWLEEASDSPAANGTSPGPSAEAPEAEMPLSMRILSGNFKGLMTPSSTTRV